ncbi:MAG: methyltransferase domain-containing protein [Bryobacterales bacterium]|nr:methyltransferase domain-containing protein [Bryobacterales bacterium]
MPPAKSGIADYSATLLEFLEPLAACEVICGPHQDFDPHACDIALFQVGNNGFHEQAWRAALSAADAGRPGIVVLHEANLHHLLADITIRAGDWDGYLREVEYDGGAAALAYARRVRALEVGPDYDGVPMLRRLLEAARGVIVHSSYMADAVRQAGYRGPVARIPHGAWLPQADAHAYRGRLGLDEIVPLIGTFGFLKPYKRIDQSLRAVRRLIRLDPRPKWILVGEEHPELPLRERIASLGLAAHARLLGFVDLEDFTGYMAACDIVLNLRYPTVGESSGSLLRAFGLGKAVLVSDVGAFREYPEDICLRVPVGAGEEDTLFEYLSLLVSRPEVARAMGARARAWVERECAWPVVAHRYIAFVEAVSAGRAAGEWEAPAATPVPAPAAAEPPPSPAAESVPPETVTVWTPEPEAQEYVETHLTRLQKTLAITPPGSSADRVLEMGAYLQITPALRSRLGYGEVRGCYYGTAGVIEHKEVVSSEGETFTCEIDHFDAERDVFPYPDGHFATVLCCELIEHLRDDPMHLMCEAHRILRPGGHLVLTTPNIASLRGIAAILQGYHPGFFHAYIRPRAPGEAVDARHNREYAPREIHQLLENAGFTVTLLETGPFRDEPHPEHAWVRHLLDRYQLPSHLRGEGIYAVGAKTGPVRERYPAWLYS